MNNYQSIIGTQGVNATSDINETLRAAGLDWEPGFDSIHGAASAILFPRKRMVFRNDTNEPLGIVGMEYKPTSPREFLTSQYEFAEYCKGSVVRAGFIPERSRAFAFVNIGDFSVLPKEHRKVGDIVRAFIYSVDGWDGMTPRTSRLYLERLVCTNGLASQKIDANLWVSHTSRTSELYGARWKVFMGQVKANMNAVKDQFMRLAETEMSRAELEAFVAKLIPGESKQAENTRTSIKHLFAEGVGNHGRTRWDALNAVTEYNTHLKKFRDTEVTSVETNRFLGVLETATLPARATELLLN